MDQVLGGLQCLGSLGLRDFGIRSRGWGFRRAVCVGTAFQPYYSAWVGPNSSACKSNFGSVEIPKAQFCPTKRRPGRSFISAQTRIPRQAVSLLGRVFRRVLAGRYGSTNSWGNPLNPQPSTPSPQPQTLNPKTLHPQP